MDVSERILREYDTIAVVGLSRSPDKAAHSVPRVLQASGFRIVPVNPFAASLLGEKAYPTLSEVSEAVDVVLVFRPATEAPRIAEQAVAIGAKALWLQQGIVSSEARRIAEGAGLLYVEDACMAVARAIHRVDKRKPPQTHA